MSASSSGGNSPQTHHNSTNSKKKFALKYLGSSILHKNFTMPMLEWIARDIKRQTSSKINNLATLRHFRVAARDVVLHVLNFKLIALSAKDGLPIFVHPMQSVTKYIQMQHDKMCFAYLMKDSKDSPITVHLYRGKSCTKVHEIFVAIREEASSTLFAPMSHHNHPEPTHQTDSASSSTTNERPSSPVLPLSSSSQQSQPQPSSKQNIGSSGAPNTNTNPNNQHKQGSQKEFEQNSYQFEVLFVRKLKLQCRRVPPSFVDDALETLKSFEVLKSSSSSSSSSLSLSSSSLSLSGSCSNNASSSLSDWADSHQSLASGKRIINASVDERQEYDDEDNRTANDNKQRQTDNSKQNSRAASNNMMHFNSVFGDDFLPYNTITSTDLNRRIAAIPAVSTSSGSLDQETRQSLARQVREALIATAVSLRGEANSSQLTCGSAPSANELLAAAANEEDLAKKAAQPNESLDKTQQQQAAAAAVNNFDFFRRSSSRQVIKNRTMLLLIGKNDLCAISIDKHQVLFNKSFNSIVHCLQGSANKDHFGLICRDSVKVNPNFDSYFGFVFKCQSEKVAREIMSALRQVIHSSQHNCAAPNSPYNPMSKPSFPISTNTQSPALTNSHTPLAIDIKPANSPVNSMIVLKKQDSTSSCLSNTNLTSNTKQKQTIEQETTANNNNKDQQLSSISRISGLGGFCDSCPLFWFHRLCCDVESLPSDACKSIILRRFDSASSSSSSLSPLLQNKLFNEREQDELLSKFSDFHIESVDEHNELFMSLLRQICERKQLRHNSSFEHSRAMDTKLKQKVALIASSSSLSSSPSSNTNFVSKVHQQHQPQTISSTLGSYVGQLLAIEAPLSPHSQHSKVSPTKHTYQHNNSQHLRCHKRTGSDGHDLTTPTPTSLVTEQRPQQQLSVTSAANSAARALSSLSLESSSSSQGIADASFAALDNLKRAKNSISVSIENLLRRRVSLSNKDETCDLDLATINTGNWSPSQLSVDDSPAPASPASVRSVCVSYAGELDDKQKTQLRRSHSTAGNSNIGVETRAARTASAAFNSWTSTLGKTLVQTGSDLGGLFRRRSLTVTETSNINDNSSNESTSATNNESTFETNLKPPSSSLLSKLGVGNSDQNDMQITANDNEKSNDNKLDKPKISTTATSISSSSSGVCLKDQRPLGPPPMLSSSFWRKNIFNKVRNQSSVDSTNQSGDSIANKCDIPTNYYKLDARAMWRRAIRESIELLRLEKQNKALVERKFGARIHQQAPQLASGCLNLHRPAIDTQKTTVDVTSKDIINAKLNYRQVPHHSDACELWSRLLEKDAAQKVQFNEVVKLVKLGVPMQLRGEVWMFLMNQFRLRHGSTFEPNEDDEFVGDPNQTYRNLLSQLSVQQHEIFVDIGRTFPQHPYYSKHLSLGQLSLFNLLKAYSLLDQHVGYCQGLSFVAGILLLHVNSEDEAFELMRHLLFNFGLRKQYLPSMDALQLQLYQLTRLLRDHEYDIFAHFDRLDISPSLYAAPWFLTLFASQFPLGFVARLLDMIFVVGIEAIFRVSLNLLAHHKTKLLFCSNLESTMEYIKNDLMRLDDKYIAEIFDKSFALNLRNNLLEYEIEYTFYCNESSKKQQQQVHVENASKNSVLVPPSMAIGDRQSSSQLTMNSTKPLGVKKSSDLSNRRQKSKQNKNQGQQQQSTVPKAIEKSRRKSDETNNKTTDNSTVTTSSKLDESSKLVDETSLSANSELSGEETCVSVDKVVGKVEQKQVNVDSEDDESKSSHDDEEDDNEDNEVNDEQTSNEAYLLQQQRSLITSNMAAATATVIIQHLLEKNHIRSLTANYSC